MKLEMRFHGVPRSRSLEAHIGKQARFALTRFGPRVRRVHVLLSDVNGPRGGEDISCKIRVELPFRAVVIREVHHDPYAAVARATERAGHAISRRLDRRQHLRRRQLRRSPEKIPFRWAASTKEPLLSGVGAGW